MRIFDRLDYTVRVLIGLLMGLMTALVLIDVFWRYMLNRPLGYPQEISIMCMVWIVMLGTAVCIRRKTHVAVTMVTENMPSPGKRFLAFFGIVVMIALFFYIATDGWSVVLRAMRQKSTITGIPQGYVAFAVPVCGVLSIAFLLEQAWLELRPRGKGEAQNA